MRTGFRTEKNEPLEKKSGRKTNPWKKKVEEKRTPAKKKIGRSEVRQATLGRRLESALKIALKVYEALIARHGHQKSADNKH